MGIKNLWRRKGRTMLTVLGVIIGTASIVVMVSLGIGMDEAFENQLEEYGSLTQIQVYGGGQYGSYAMEETTASVSSEKVAMDDALVDQIESIEHVEYALGFKRFDGILYAGRYQNWAGIRAMDISKLKELEIDLSEGEFPSAEGKNEVLIGYQVSQNFYDPNSRNPYGNETVIDMMDTKIELIPSSDYSEKKPRGYVLNATGITTEDDWNYAWDVIMDYDAYEKIKADYDRRNKSDDSQTGKSRSRSSDKVDKYDEMVVSVDEVDNVQTVQTIITEMGFEAYSLTDALENSKQTSSLIQAVLGGVGAVSLFVAAIGITNTMVMSIYERTKEIGVMKVIGAQLRDIRNLFLFEAAMIGFFGGVFGVGLSYIISFVVNTVLSGMGGDSGYYGPQMLSSIPYWLALLGIGFSTLIGIIAGYYPAVRATKLSALEAIRTE